MPDTPTTSPTWQETFLGGSEAAEARIFSSLIERMAEVQSRNSAQAPAGQRLRTLHAEILAGVDDAVFEVAPDLPADLAQHHFQPGAQLRATVRLSFASGVPHGGAKRDMRGAAIRLHLPGDQVHELLLTNFPVSHARTAEQFVAFASIMSGAKALILPRLLWNLGLSETLRLLGNLKQATGVTRRLSQESFWTRGALLWADAGPVRLQLHPASPEAEPATPPTDIAGDFAHELAQRDVVYHLSAQRYVSEALTPIEDGCTGWDATQVPFVRIATLRIARRDLRTPEAQATQKAVDATPFNPWYAPAAFRPLGNLNRIRRDVYAASAARWR